MFGINPQDVSSGASFALRRPKRREFLKLGMAGAGLLLGAEVLRAAPRSAWAAPTAAGEVEVLLLNCMDYRLVNEVTTYLNERGMTNRYDQVILAGASLAVASGKFPDWANTFWQHLDVAIELHHVQQVIALDHRDCGAY